MKGLKFILIGIAIILIGGFFLTSTEYTLGGYGEILLFLIGIGTAFYGLKQSD